MRFGFYNTITQFSSVNLINDSVVFLCQNSGHISALPSSRPFLISAPVDKALTDWNFIIALSSFSALVLSTENKASTYGLSRGLRSKWMTP